MSRIVRLWALMFNESCGKRHKEISHKLPAGIISGFLVTVITELLRYATWFAVQRPCQVPPVRRLSEHETLKHNFLLLITAVKSAAVARITILVFILLFLGQYMHWHKPSMQTLSIKSHQNTAALRWRGHWTEQVSVKKRRKRWRRREKM